MRNAIVFAFAALLALSLAACSHGRFEPPERDGPIGLVDTGSGKQAWMALTQEEEVSRHVGGGSRRIGRLWESIAVPELRGQAESAARQLLENG